MLALYQSACDSGKRALFVVGTEGFAVLHTGTGGERVCDVPSYLCAFLGTDWRSASVSVSVDAFLSTHV
jgi:hypothetical protein